MPRKIKIKALVTIIKLKVIELKVKKSEVEKLRI